MSDLFDVDGARKRGFLSVVTLQLCTVSMGTIRSWGQEQLSTYRDPMLLVSNAVSGNRRMMADYQLGH